MYNPNMNLERTPLLLERRGRTRDSIHRASDRARARGSVHGKRHKKRRKMKTVIDLISRERDDPRARIAMLGPGAPVPVAMSGIIKHS